MRKWADIYVVSLTERDALEKKALFFLPSALARCLEADVNGRFLESLAQTAGLHEPAGRVAIRRVLRMVPVTYRSVLGFITVANHALIERGHAPFTTEDIVACVFRLKDCGDIMNELGVTPATVAQCCHLPLNVARAAHDKFRLQYVDADIIWRFLCFAKWFTGRRSVRLETLTADPMDFIKTDSRMQFAVRELEEQQYVYEEGNLRLAPKAGHPWAIIDDEANA